VDRRDPHFLTFVNPCPDKGLYPFARIADELGRRRPDIPILVVESRGTEADLIACGVDLRRHGTVHLMSLTPDPRDFWGVTRICLMPSVFRETQGLVAVRRWSTASRSSPATEAPCPRRSARRVSSYLYQFT
jgi:hypothetical protein